MHDDQLTAPVLRLAFRCPEAAVSLGISERHLWALTARGEVPHVKLGSATVYPVRALEEWLARQVEVQGAEPALKAVR